MSAPPRAVEKQHGRCAAAEIWHFAAQGQLVIADVRSTSLWERERGVQGSFDLNRNIS